jgi:hypothetical protein
MVRLTALIPSFRRSICPNYARYYPDQWVLDVERSTPLALAIEELCELSEWRVPWLSLCELGRTLLVNET